MKTFVVLELCPGQDVDGRKNGHTDGQSGDYNLLSLQGALNPNPVIIWHVYTKNAHVYSVTMRNHLIYCLTSKPCFKDNAVFIYVVY